MADSQDTAHSPERASKSELLNLGDRLDQAHYRVTAARLAASALWGDTHATRTEVNAVSLLFLELEQVMAELCDSFEHLVLRPNREKMQS